MKVLQIINSLGTGGAEKLLLETIPLYEQKGIIVDLLVLWDNNFPFLHELRKHSNCNIYILSRSSNIQDIYSLSLIPKIRKIIKDYEIIHVHLFPSQYFVSIANIGLGKKLIFTEHSTSNKRLGNKFFKILDKLIYSSFFKIIGISNDVINVLQEHIPHRKRDIIKIENGVNISKIGRARSYKKTELNGQIKESDVLICQVSAFRKGKDQQTLVRAMTLLPEIYKLILVGDGDIDQFLQVQQLIQKLNLGARVFMLGNRMDVDSIIKSVDFNVLSSEWEGLSLASVEGMSSGRPFIATDVPGLKEIVQEAGVLFPLGDERTFAQIILSLHHDENWYTRIVKSCQERSKKYDIEVMVNKHIELYKSVYGKG